jgi:AraC-like DNA-binding protein
METFTASSLPSGMRAAAWNDLYSSRLDKAELTPADQEFDAELRLGELGPIRVARLTCGRSSIRRTHRHIAQASGRTYCFILQARGGGVFTHYGHEAGLAEGDLVLCDSAAPYAFTLEDGSELVMLRVAANVLKEHLPSPEYFCGRRLQARQGLTDTAAALTLSLCRQLETGVSQDFQDRVARHLLDVIATSYAIAFDPVVTASANVSDRQAKVKLYIEQHLRDPVLSPCSIAARLRLSPRYLRMIFATGAETVSAYILRRRLEECARQMSDRRWRGHSITEVAFAWGFNSAPHFTRSFRLRFGVSPRSYRRQQLEREAA